MRTITLFLSLALAGSCAAALQPPAAPAGTPAAPAVYDEKADGAAAIDAAIARSAKNNRRVLVQWGANWCSWCKLLHGTMERDAGLSREMLYEYDLVRVDVGKFDKNMDLAAKYGAELKKNGIPYLTVLDGSGRPIANQETGSLEAKGAPTPGHDTAAVLKFLKDHQAPARAAEDVLKDGLSRAKTEGKVVFLHFGAPWCGWCHRLEDWMEKPRIAAVLGKAFVDVKIDVDRDRGGKGVLAKFGAREDEGIPWFAFVGADGKPLATSTGPEGNTGFPSQPGEIEHFASMLRAAGTKLSGAEIDELAASLRAGATGAH
jgi:thiol-disulfide isomerase/thioredoxin